MNVTSGLELSGENVGADNHVIGTRKEDLQQFYSGRVTIKGSLTVNNLRFSLQNPEIYANGLPFDTDVEQFYWVDNESQVNMHNNKLMLAFRVILRLLTRF